MPAPTPQFRIAEIDARRPSPGAIIECLRFDNDTRQGRSFSLLAFAEIHSTSYVYERLLDTVHAALNQARTLVTGMDGDPMVRFEKIVQKTNDALAQFAAGEATPIHWQRVNLFLFQLADEHLCVSGLGTLTNIFLQRQDGGAAKAFDLLGSLEQPETTDARKPLASIVCGTMGVGDVLFVGTQNLQDAREAVEIIPLCQAHPPVAAAQEIQQRLQDRKTHESFFAVLIAGVALTAPKSEPPAQIDEPGETDAEPPDAKGSPFVHEAEIETAKILDHGIATERPSLGAMLATARTRIADTFDKRPSTASSGPSLLSPLSQAGLRGMNAGYTRGLFAAKQKLLVGAVLGSLLLAGGGLWIRSVRNTQAEQRLWTAVYDQSVEAKNRAEAAIVYGDEERARAQFAQAQTAFQQLDEKTPDRIQARVGLGKELDEIRTRLRKETSVEAPTVVADLRQDGETGGFEGLVVQNGTAYVLDNTRNQVRTIDLKTGAVAAIEAPEAAALRIVGNGQSGPLVVAGERTLFAIRGDALVPLSASTLTRASSTTALTNYGKRLYVLDAAAGMIWRYAASGTGISGENAYLATPSEELRQGVSLAIDSSIYVATAEGDVHKFTSGQREGWGLMPIDPPLRRASQIWTQSDSPLLVLSDPEDKRVLVFTKAGKLNTQITSPTFSGPTAAWGDPTSNALYVLDGGRLLRFDLPRE